MIAWAEYDAWDAARERHQRAADRLQYLRECAGRYAASHDPRVRRLVAIAVEDVHLAEADYVETRQVARELLAIWQQAAEASTPI